MLRQALVSAWRLAPVVGVASFSSTTYYMKASSAKAVRVEKFGGTVPMIGMVQQPGSSHAGLSGMGLRAAGRQTLGHTHPRTHTQQWLAHTHAPA